MTTNEVSTLLGSKHVRKSKGQFKYWSSYYWGFSKNADSLIAKVKEKIPAAVIVDSGNHFHDFVGGAKSGSAKDSYLWVTFTVADADMPVSCNSVTKRFLNQSVTAADLMRM